MFSELFVDSRQVSSQEICKDNPLHEAKLRLIQRRKDRNNNNTGIKEGKIFNQLRTQ